MATKKASRNGRYGYAMGGAPKGPPWKRDFGGGYTAEWTTDEEVHADDRHILARYVLRCTIRHESLDAALATEGLVLVQELDDPRLIDIEARLLADASLDHIAREVRAKLGRPTRFDRILRVIR